MAVVHNKSVTGGGNGVNSFNFAALTTGTDNALLIAVVSYSNGSASITSIVAGGNSLTSGATRVGNAGNGATNGYTEFWYGWVATAGTPLTFTVTMGGSAFPQVSGVLSAYSGASQSVGAVASSSGAGANPSISVTTTANSSLIVGLYGEANNNAYTAGSGETINATATGGGTVSMAAQQRQNSTTAISGTSATDSITCAASNWAGFAVELLQAAPDPSFIPNNLRPRAFTPGIAR